MFDCAVCLMVLQGSCNDTAISVTAGTFMLPGWCLEAEAAVEGLGEFLRILERGDKERSQRATDIEPYRGMREGNSYLQTNTSRISKTLLNQHHFSK